MVSRSMRKYLFGGLVTIGILMASCISEKDEHAPEISAVIGYGVNLDKIHYLQPTYKHKFE